MSDKIADIRERHKASDNNFIEYESTWDIHADRATLLAEVARLNKDLLAQNACCDGAAAQDAHVRQEREEHRAEVEKLRREIKNLREAMQSLAERLEVDPSGTDKIDDLEAEIERLRAAATSAGAALAAAIDLLERGREDAPSKRMFSQMLADYRVIVARTRNALEGKP